MKDKTRNIQSSTYICKNFDNGKCIKKICKDECDREQVIYCFKNYPKFFEEALLE